MPRKLLFIVRRENGWAYKIDTTYSTIYPSQAEASSAALQVAHANFPLGILMQVLAQMDDGTWHPV